MLVARSVLLLLALAPVSAGASATRPPVALTASPAHVQLSGAGQATVRVTNAGAERVVVGAGRAGFALDLRGRPKIVAASIARRSAAGWLSIRPRNIVLEPGASDSVIVAAKPPSGAEPGDHDALVLLTTRPRARNRLVVRMRMGVVVVVRVPGTVRRRIVLRGFRVAASRRVRTLELMVANRGNVTEAFSRTHSLLSLYRAGRRIARLAAEPRTLRPGTLGVIQFRYRGEVSGRVIGRVDVRSESGCAIRQTLRLRI